MGRRGTREGRVEEGAEVGRRGTGGEKEEGGEVGRRGTREGREDRRGKEKKEDGDGCSRV